MDSQVTQQEKSHHPDSSDFNASYSQFREATWLKPDFKITKESTLGQIKLYLNKNKKLTESEYKMVSEIVQKSIASQKLPMDPIHL